MNEFEIIDWIRTNWRSGTTVSLGPGDDCGIFQAGDASIAVSVDAITENIHFDAKASARQTSTNMPFGPVFVLR